MDGRNLQIRKEDSKAEFQTIQNQNLSQERTEELIRDMEVLDWTAEQQTQNIIPEKENMFVDKKKHKSHTSYTFKGLGGGTFRNQKEEQKKIRAQVDLQRKVRRDAVIKDGDTAMETSKTYQKTISAITNYADMDFDSTTSLEQGEKLTLARKEIEASIKAIQEKITKETDSAKLTVLQIELMNLVKYKDQFDNSADGKLQIPANAPDAWKIDHRKNMKLHPIQFGISPSWKDMRDQPLFSHEPSFGDVKQRMIGDCYLEAALVSQLHADPEKIKECMKDNGDGTVTVRFYKECTEEADIHPEIMETLEKKDITKMSDEELLLKFFYEMTTENGESLCGYTMSSMLAEQGENISERQIKRIVKKAQENAAFVYDFLFLTDSFTKHGQNLKTLADSMAGYEYMKAVFAKVRSLAEKKGKPSFNIGDMVNAIAEFIKEEQKKELNDAFSEQMRNIMNGSAEMRALYVTVTKEIPALLGKPVYSGGAMWVHMIQKAYAASGLHGTDEAYKNKPELKDSYERIEGGHSSEFLRTFTGAENMQSEHNVLNAKNANDFFNAINDRLLNLRRVNANDPVLSLANYLKNALAERLKGKHLKTYKNGTYCTGPISFEEVHKELFSTEKWLTEDVLNHMINSHTEKKKYKDDVERISGKPYPDFFQCVSEATKLLFELMQGNHNGITLQHEAFAVQKNDDGTESAAYTLSAIACYENIREALENNIPVAIGTKAFIPNDVSSSGLNDEAMADGLVESHAYTVMGVQEIDGRKYIQLRNPWGHKGRGYEKIVTPAPNGGTPIVSYKAKSIDSQLSHPQKGIFLMELNDFVCRADNIYGIRNAFTPKGGAAE